MIAIITKYEQHYHDLRLIPKEMFVRVRRINDVCGRKFTGIIILGSLIGMDNNTLYALNVLKGRQPELFD